MESRTLRWIAVVILFPLPACLLVGCGGGNPALSQLNVTLTPNWTVALDMSQTLSLTASASTPSGATFLGFDWSLTCGGGNCGTITAHTANGSPATYAAPATPPSGPVTITALLIGHPNSVGTMVTVSSPPKVATTGTLLPATPTQYPTYSF